MPVISRNFTYGLLNKFNGCASEIKNRNRTSWKKKKEIGLPGQCIKLTPVLFYYLGIKVSL